MKNKATASVVATLVFGLLKPAVVHAHLVDGQIAGAAHGPAHALGGLELFLIMVAVGVCAALIGWRAR